MSNSIVWGPNKPSSVMTKNMSPKTLSFEDACLDESNTNIRRICENGMQCPTRLAKDASKCNQEHVLDHIKVREEVRQQWFIDQMADNILQETISRTASPVQLINTKYDITMVDKLSLTYNIATYDIKSGIITFSNNNKPTKIVNTSSVPSSSSSPLVIPKKEQKNDSINVVFNSSGNNFKMNTSMNNPPKINNDDDDYINPQKERELKKEQKKEQKKKEENKVASARNSPVPMIRAATPIATNDTKQCNFTNKCTNAKCTFNHPTGYIPGSVKPNTCHNSDKCFNQHCKFIHPDGYVPKPNVRCLGGEKCHKEAAKKNSCPFSHPGDAYYDSIPENTRAKKN